MTDDADAQGQEQITEAALRVQRAIHDMGVSVRLAGYPRGLVTCAITRALVENAKIDGLPERDTIIGLMSVWDDIPAPGERN